MEDPKILILKPTIGAIYDILHMENCKVSGIEGVPEVNKLIVNPGHIDLEFDSTITDVPASYYIENLPKLDLHTNNGIYQTPPYGSCFEGIITMDGHLTQHFDIRFNRLTQTTINDGQKYYWRFVYPVVSNEWFLKIKGQNFTDDYGLNHYSNLVVADLNGHKVYLFSFVVDNNHWMIIESTESIGFEEMDHQALSVICSLGFVLGKRYGDYCFHVASNEATFSQIEGVEVFSLKTTRNCPYKILNPQKNLIVEWLKQFKYQKYALDEIVSNPGKGLNWYHEEESIVTVDAFSKLAQLCYKSNDMLLATSMLIDGSLMNVEYQKPFFHITLEAITTALLNDDVKQMTILPQDQYNNEVVPALVKVLKGMGWITEEARSILTKRITNNLNFPPNSNKLEILFPMYGYSLTRLDKIAIDKRNSTFHGHLSSGNKLLRAQQGDMLAMSLRLHKLCSILLLKEAGFSGKVLNNEVLYGIKEACELKEPIYIEI